MAVWIALLAVFICLIPVFMNAAKKGSARNRKKDGSDGGSTAASSDTGAGRKEDSDRDSDSGSDAGSSGDGGGGGD